MPRTVQIRNLDDDVYAALAKRAADVGLAVPELLRREVTKIARRPSVDGWLERTRLRRPAMGRSRDTLEALDELRGPWPT